MKILKYEIPGKTLGRLLLGIFVGFVMYNLISTNSFLDDQPKKIGFVLLSILLTIVVLSLITE